LPNADFSVNFTLVFEGEFVEFTFNGSEGDPPATYLWDFGDLGPTSTDQNPIHQYATAGTYTVSLGVTDDDGDYDNEVKTSFINVEADISPTSDFIGGETNIYQGEYIQFTCTGTQGNAPATFLWDFGDGSPTSDLQNPLHQYLIVGVYNVSLSVTDRNGDEDSLVKIDYINVSLNEIPNADFISNETIIKEGEEIQFNFTGFEGTVPTSYQWDFGDSSPISIDKNPTHQYTTAGTYTVTLVVTDANGDFDTEIKSNYIVVEEFQMKCVINSPQMNDEYADDAPAYNITVSGVNIHTMWYTLNDNDGLKYYFSEFSGIINQSAWDALPEGHVAVRFYIQDVSRGTIVDLVIVVKDLTDAAPPTPGIPGYDLTIVIGSLSIICIVLIKRFQKHYS